MLCAPRYWLVQVITDSHSRLQLPRGRPAAKMNADLSTAL
jgi:hypothetical protein